MNMMARALQYWLSHISICKRQWKYSVCSNSANRQPCFHQYYQYLHDAKLDKWKWGQSTHHCKCYKPGNCCACPILPSYTTSTNFCFCRQITPWIMASIKAMVPPPIFSACNQTPLITFSIFEFNGNSARYTSHLHAGNRQYHHRGCTTGTGH